MPTIIDKIFAEAVMQIKDDEFLGALKGLRSQEIRAALERLHEVQLTLTDLDNQGQLIAMPGSAMNGERTWDQITLGDYAKRGGFSSQPGDYMNQLAQPVEDAINAMKANP